MKIRPFKPSDLPTLYEIDQSCFPPGISYSKSEIARFISHRGSRTWVAEDGNRTVGFLIVGKASREVGHIVTIDVLEGWRRKGVGRALMDAVEAWAGEQGLRTLYLETAEDNLAAQRFYQRRNYLKIEKIERYYNDGKAAWVMAKTIRDRC
jgi:ribosomal-protein-alanine N-acetyltransferase